MKYLLLTTTPGVKHVIHTPKRLELEQLQRLVGGLIEFAPVPEQYRQELKLPQDAIAIVNEEGLCNNLPPNPFFACIGKTLDGEPVDSIYYGDVLIGHDVMDEDSGRDFMGYTDNVIL